MKILITGGTGVLGTVLAQELKSQNADFVLASRHLSKTQSYAKDVVQEAAKTNWRKLDLVKNEGVKQALEGIHTAVHLASGFGKVHGQAEDIVAIKNLIDAAQKIDLQHLIFISIVGVDKVPLAYYQTKYQVEQYIKQQKVPFTILRVTQFHNFIEAQIQQMVRLPIGFVPKKLKSQPIQLEAAAKEITKLIKAGVQNEVLNIGGKEVLDFGTFAKTLLHYTKKSKPIVNVPIIGKFMHALAEGNLTCKEVSLKSCTWEEYLVKKYGEI